MMILRFTSLAFLYLVLATRPAAAFELAWPVACELGKTCWIQQYADHDLTSGAADYTCGTQSYDTHDGTDIRVRTTADTADIVASAPGVVKGTRNTVPDRLVRAPQDRAAIAGMECGNGLVLDHGGGWVTQYCHMKQGSLAVKTGDKVGTGQKLGEVGYSGDAGFPHLHLSVRKDGKKIDPFSGELGADCQAADTSLWSEKVQRQLTYQDSTLLALGFADHKVELPELEEGTLQPLTPGHDPPALVAYMWAINLKQGDEVTVTLAGPAGELARNSLTLDRNKAQYLLLSGRKQPANGWPPGTYKAQVVVTNQGQTSISQATEMILD